MTSKNFLVPALFIVSILFSGCSGLQDGNGVTVHVGRKTDGGPSLVRLEVMDESIIHVSATPENRFSDKESLVIMPPAHKTPFTVTEHGDTVSLSTSSLVANVLTTTGEVWFTRPDGTVILQEKNGGGKTFVPVEAEGTDGYSFRQVFETP